MIVSCFVKSDFTRTTESSDDDPKKLEISQIKFQTSTITKCQKKFKNIIGINRVVLRKDKTLLFVVPNPEVFRKGDTWVVLGEARVEDPNQRAREMAAKKMAEQQAVKTPAKPVPTTISEEDEVNGFLNFFPLKSDIFSCYTLTM